MYKWIKTLSVFVFCCFTFLSCKQTSTAFLDANFVASGDVTGTQSARARINFTDFNQPPGPSGNDEKLRMTFTNPEGDSLSLVLSPVNGGFPLDTYFFDGSLNTFSVSVTVTFASGVETISDVSKPEGYITLESVNIVEGVLKGIKANFYVNFVNGGAGQGEVSFSN